MYQISSFQELMRRYLGQAHRGGGEWNPRMNEEGHRDRGNNYGLHMDVECIGKGRKGKVLIRKSCQETENKEWE